MPTHRLQPGESSRTTLKKRGTCEHADHSPTGTFEPGVYEHTCEGCGRVILFTVTGKERQG